MALDKEAIEEFRDIHYEEFGERLSDAKAQKMGEDLLLLFKLIYRPLPENKKENKNKDT